MSGASDEALLAAIEQGQAAQLIEETEDDRYRFRHALLREALYEEMVALRRRLWHRIVAESLESQPLPDPDSIAYHYGQAREQGRRLAGPSRRTSHEELCLAHGGGAAGGGARAFRDVAGAVLAPLLHRSPPPLDQPACGRRILPGSSCSRRAGR